MAQHTVVVEQASTEEKKKRKKLPFILGGIGVLAIVPLVGSTFAASISLNSGSTIEFGQGTVNAAACDSSIDVKLSSTVINASGTPTFALDTIKLSNINLTDCASKTITVRLADYSGNLLPLDASNNNSFDVVIASDGTATAAGASVSEPDSTTILIGTNPDTPTTLFWTNSGITVHSTDVAKVLLESKDS
jgi:hypothetical protein